MVQFRKRGIFSTVVYDRRKPASSESCCVWGALALTLRAARMSGVSPLQFTKHNHHYSVRFSPTMHRVNCVVLLILYGIMILATILDFNLPEKVRIRGRTTAGKVMWIITLSTLFVTQASFIFNGPKLVKDMIEYLNTVNNVHVHLSNSKWQPKERMKKLAAILILASGFAVEGSSVLIHLTFSFRNQVVDAKDTVTAIFIALNILKIQTVVIEMQLLFIGLAIESVLKRINNKLKKHVCASGNREEPIDANNVSISDLAVAYAVTCGSLRKFNDSIGLNLLLILFYIFISLVFLILQVIAYINVLSSGIKIVNGFYLLWHTANIMIITEAGHRLHVQMERSKLLLTQLAGSMGSDDPRSVDIDLFYKQILLNRIPLTAMRIFELNRYLVLAVYTAITNAVVISIQFKANV